MDERLPRLLLVDDEERFRQTLCKRLAEMGFPVATAGSGQEALARIREEPFDVVVLDVMMPGLSGMETLHEIQKLGCGVEVLMLTGHSTIESAIEGMRLGAHYYLLKPCDINELVEKIHSAYAVKQSRDQRLRQAEERALLDQMEKKIRF